MIKKAYVFDLDGTLVNDSREEIEYPESRCNFNVFNERLIKILKDNKVNSYILTARPDIKRMNITNFFKVKVYCRDFFNTYDEMMKVYKREIKGNIFRLLSAGYKIKTLLKIAEKYDEVWFFDDHLEMYKEYEEFLNRYRIVLMIP